MLNPVPETTGRFKSTSHQSYRITKPAQKVPLAIKREEKKKKKKQLEDRES